jgi:hypothetical protein
VQVQLLPETTGVQVLTADAASWLGKLVMVTSVPNMLNGTISETGKVPVTVIVWVLDGLLDPGSRSPVTVASVTTGAGRVTAKVEVALPAPWVAVTRYAPTGRFAGTTVDQVPSADSGIVAMKADDDNDAR